MRYLLDTNVLSELSKRPPDANVVVWVNAQSAVDFFASVFTVGELTKGLSSMPPGRRRDELRAWATQDLARLFLGRLLPIDEAIATATVHGLVLVTRNEHDCADRGVPILNPWL